MARSGREDLLVGIEPERPHRGADDQQAAATMNGASQLPPWARKPNTIGDSAPPKLPAMFIMPDTVPEYLPPVSIGTAQDGPMVHSRKNIEAVRP